MKDQSPTATSLTDDLLGSVIRPPSVRVSSSFRTSSFNRSAAAAAQSPSNRRQNPQKSPLKDNPIQVASGRWVSKYFTRRLPWVILIALWIFLVLRIYSSHGELTLWNSEEDQELRQHSSRTKDNATHRSSSNSTSFYNNSSKSGLSRLAREWIWNFYLKKRRTPNIAAQLSDKSSSKRERRVISYLNSSQADFNNFQSLKSGDYFLGSAVGPYDKVEKEVLGAANNSIESSCVKDEGYQFRQFIKGKRVVVVMHELTMTGSPLAMMELASEIINCGGKVSAVVLDKRGGLLSELSRRNIPLVKDKKKSSWREAAKAHLLVAGSAVCALWIDEYLTFDKKAGRKIVWWVMENRREYFDRSKYVLGKVRTLIFLSKLQAEMWEEWSKEESIHLPSERSIVSLSVNDAVATSAGLMNGNKNITRGALDKLTRLRATVRKEMGLDFNDTLFLSLSSINPTKGQLMMLRAASVALKEMSDEKRDSMKLVIGSVGSKSNKEEYIEKILSFLHHQPSLTRSLFWSPATVSVTSLYAAADVYLMNAQGIGETFGRVTIEAMAFGLPVLGTNAGGTSEIVDANSSGLLHPVGIKGVPVLANNMRKLVRDATLRKEMGKRGREKVKELYMKRTMYDKLTVAFSLVDRL